MELGLFVCNKEMRKETGEANRKLDISWGLGSEAGGIEGRVVEISVFVWVFSCLVLVSILVVFRSFCLVRVGYVRFLCGLFILDFGLN